MESWREDMVTMINMVNSGLSTTQLILSQDIILMWTLYQYKIKENIILVTIQDVPLLHSGPLRTSLCLFDDKYQKWSPCHFVNSYKIVPMKFINAFTYITMSYCHMYKLFQVIYVTFPNSIWPIRKLFWGFFTLIFGVQKGLKTYIFNPIRNRVKGSHTYNCSTA